MANTLARPVSDHSLMEMSTPAIIRIDRKPAVSTPRAWSENTTAGSVELLRRLSALVDGFARLSTASQLPIERLEPANRWNIFDYADAILSGIHGEVRFQRSPNDSSIFDNSHYLTPTGPGALRAGFRPSLLTKSDCS